MWTALISPLASLAVTFLEGQVSKSKAESLAPNRGRCKSRGYEECSDA